MKQMNQTTRCFDNVDKDKTNSYFKKAKVNSCRYVLVKNGQNLAVPFKITNLRKRGLNHFKTVPEKSQVVKSVYEHDYSPFPNMHCGMKRKPLIPYEPYSYRSRLPTMESEVFLQTNRSNVDIGNDSLINRKQWESTYRDNFKWPRSFPISNPGILSDMAKQSHMKLETIN